MKPKTIERILNKKFDTLLESIKDESVKKSIKKNTIITGGCIVSMLLKEPVNDYDLYFRNFITAKKVAEYFLEVYKENKKAKGSFVPEMSVCDKGGRIRVAVGSAGVDSETSDHKDYRFFETLDPGSPEQEGYIENVVEVITKDNKDEEDKFRPIFLTSNAITLSDKIQLILRFYGEPDDIHKNYDFVHCTNYWTSWDKKLILNKESLQSMISRELIYSGSLYPICSVMRLRKFIERGWTINAGQVFKICYQISKLNLDDPNVLYDQLLGVDVAYFYDLICRLKSAEENKIDIDYIYICELIDKIW